MKLKTKFQDEDFDLGEVVEISAFHSGANKFEVEARAARGGCHTFYFGSLKELTDMFEDYEEPKVYYYISDFGAIRECEIGKFPEDEEYRKQIGNYFETREEAENYFLLGSLSNN